MVAVVLRSGSGDGAQPDAHPPSSCMLLRVCTYTPDHARPFLTMTCQSTRFNDNTHIHMCITRHHFILQYSTTIFLVFCGVQLSMGGCQLSSHYRKARRFPAALQLSVGPHLQSPGVYGPQFSQAPNPPWSIQLARRPCIKAQLRPRDPSLRPGCTHPAELKPALDTTAGMKTSAQGSILSMDLIF